MTERSKPTPYDGGPAFPKAESDFIDHPVHGHIHRAQVGLESHPGMSLRDWFAGQALSHPIVRPGASPQTIAKVAYELADAMIAARAQGGAA